MKNLKQKLLISLILGLGLFIGCSFAETINVQGRNPWGVLRLNKIILQKTNAINLTGILLDGQDYVIRVGSVYQSGVTIIGSGSKVHTNQICDANGNNCKQVSALGNGGSGGGNGSGITAFGTGGEICYLYTGDDGSRNLMCDNSVLQVLSGTIAQLVAFFRHTPAQGQGTGTVVPVIVSNTGANTGYYCSSTDGDTLKCNNPVSGLGGGSGITALGTGGEICYLYTGDDGSRNLMCDNSVLQVLSGTIAQLVAFFRHTPAGDHLSQPAPIPAIVSSTGSSTGYYCSSTGGDMLKCDNPVSGLGDSYRKAVRFSKNGTYITGVSLDDQNNYVYLYFGSLDNRIYHNGTLKIQKAGVGLDSSPIQFDSKGARFGDLSSTAYTGAGVGINGGALVLGSQGGCSDNKISIFASGSNQDANYEILGSQRLVVGAYNSSYMYLTNNNNVGVNTSSESNINSTLTVNGGVRVGNCGTDNACRQEIAGEIRYIETTNTGYFIGCVKMQGNTPINGVNRRNYARIKLTDGTKHETQITNSESCSNGMPYNINNYLDMGVVANPGQCDS